jgi:hypothetical protein
LGHDASPILRRGKIPRHIKDSTVSIYFNGLKDGTPLPREQFSPF